MGWARFPLGNIASLLTGRRVGLFSFGEHRIFDVIPIGSRIDDRFIGRISVIFDILSGFYYEIPIR